MKELADLPLRFRDASGRWVQQVSTAETKLKARRLALELEQKAERQRLGLEPVPAANGGGTLEELLSWWLETYSKGTPNHGRNETQIRKHFYGSKLAALPLIAVTRGGIETFLEEKAKGPDKLAPATLNHLRKHLVLAFNRAREVGRWEGRNPAQDVRRRRVPKRLPDYLKADEVPRVLAALTVRWRPLFATAIYTGLRKGELLGLRKRDVDLAAGLLSVIRSYGHDTTKGGCADAIPIATELRPYLECAIRASPSELVFPDANGKMMRPDVDLPGVLRRAMARAGIVTGYKHVCRRPGCGYTEAAPDAAVRRCPKHGRLEGQGPKLWPKPQVRPIRFHDTRHYADLRIMPRWAHRADFSEEDVALHAA